MNPRVARPERRDRRETTVAADVLLNTIGVERRAVPEAKAHERTAGREVAADKLSGEMHGGVHGTRRGQTRSSLTSAGTTRWTCADCEASVVDPPS